LVFAARRSGLVSLPEGLLDQGLALRPEASADDAFLLGLYRTTRQAELDQLGWGEEEQLAFVTHQFNAQRTHYRHSLENCAFDIIERQGQPIGRLYTQERVTQLHILDITLSPEVRGAGLGGAILTELHQRASAVGKGIGIFVEVYNPARHLYDRLGFVPVGAEHVYLEMEWPAAGSPVVS
jgi:predicted GNAT family acetyltransferase